MSAARSKLVFRASGSTDGRAPGADLAEAGRALAILVDPDRLLGLRAFVPGRKGARNLIAPPADEPAITAKLNEWHGNGRNIYLNINPIKNGTVRPEDRGALVEHIDFRRWFLIDIDPEKPPEFADASATDEEKSNARLLMLRVKDYLLACDWPAPVEIDSGNGWYLLYRIELPNNPASQDLLKRALAALAARFDGPQGKIDPKVHDATRIVKLPGTLARKGVNRKDRPWRPCRLLYAPEPVEFLPDELLCELAGVQAGDETAARPPASASESPPAPKKDAPPRSSLIVRATGSDVEKRAIAYLGRCPESVSGSRGHDKAFWAARVLVYGFNLSQADSLRILLAEFNHKCTPPWSESELLHKVEQADNVPYGKDRGWLLTDGDSDGNCAFGGDGGEARNEKSKRTDEQKTGRKKLKWYFSLDSEVIAAGEPGDLIAEQDDGEDDGEDRIRLFEMNTIGTLIDKTFPEPNWIIPGIMSEGLNILAGAPKQGKAQPFDAKVLTPSGYRTMGELAIGDEVVAADGLPASIVAVHPQGDKPVFRVTFSDGVAVEATEDHWWQVFTHTDRVRNKPGRLLTTGQLKAVIAAGKNRDTYVPVCAPIQFAALSQPLPIDPYLLGVILGDGSITQKTVCVSFGDDAILGCLAGLLPEGVSVSKGQARYAYLVHRKGHVNPLARSLRQLGLMGKHSYDKEIPEKYLFASQEERFAMVQGLLDTDGTITLNKLGNGLVTYATTSVALARGLAFLVQSLGGTARMRTRQPYAHKNGEKKAGRLCWVVTVRLPDALGCPFRLPVKVEKWGRSRPTAKTPPVRRVVAVETAGAKPCRCITINRPDGLYLTDHCIVTHNSMLALNLALTVAGGGMALGNIAVPASDVLYLSLEDKQRRIKDRTMKMIPAIGSELSAQARQRLTIVTDWPKQDEGGLKLMKLWFGRVQKPGLVIIDVWNRFAPTQKNSGSTYGHDAEAMSEVKRFVEKFGATALVVHHTRKPGMKEPEDFVHEISGTMGLSGTADGIMVLIRNRQDSQAALHITGRDVTEQELVLQFDIKTLTWKSLGTSAQHIGGRVQEKIVRYLKGLGEGSAFVKDIAAAIEEKEDSVRKALSRMHKDRVVRKVGNSWAFPGEDEVGDGVEF